MLVALVDADVQIEAKPHDVCLFRVPFDAIKSVRVGARASAETRETIRSLLRENPKLSHIEYIEMQISSERFQFATSKII